MSRNVINRYKANIDTLTAAYPKLFDKANPQPLAVGTLDQLVEGNQVPLSKTMIRDCLAVWCRRHEYLTALLGPWAMRRNLDYSIQGPVTNREQDKTKRIIEGKRQRAVRSKLMELPTVDDEQDPELLPQSPEFCTAICIGPTDHGIKATSIEPYNLDTISLVEQAINSDSAGGEKFLVKDYAFC